MRSVLTPSTKDPFPITSVGEVGDESKPRLADGRQPSLGEGFGIDKILTHRDPIFPYGGRLSL